MRVLIEGLLILLVLVILIGAVYIVITEYKKDLDKQDLQFVTYSECLATDYDKFQCYSMIYGDK